MNAVGDKGRRADDQSEHELEDDQKSINGNSKEGYRLDGFLSFRTEMNTHILYFTLNYWYLGSQ
jgi:hypothetical protein